MGGSGGDGAPAITVDGAGDVYVAGVFQNTVDLDPGAGTTFLSSNGSSDVFVQKLDSTGALQWVKSFGGSSQEDVFEIAVDSAGNVYTTGRFEGTVDFDPGAGTANIASAGSVDAFVSKLDSAGNFVWAQGLGGGGDEHGTGIVIDSGDNLSISGTFQGTVDFDPGPGSFNLTSAGVIDAFLWQLDANGNFLEAMSFSGANVVSADGIALDSVGNIYMAGAFAGTADFDPGPVIANLTSNGSLDVYLVKLLAPNTPPVAVDDDYEVNEDGVLVVDAANGVLDNDSDPDMDVLTVTQVVSGPSNGALTLNADGSFTYSPFANFNGSDTFIYEISDGNGGLATTTVTIDVLSAQQQIDNVTETVQALVSDGSLNKGQGNSLTKKLAAAAKKIDQDKTKAGINQLEAFIHQIDALFAAGILDDLEADDLIDQIAKSIASAG